jgi:hypothetical protein
LEALTAFLVCGIEEHSQEEAAKGLGITMTERERACTRVQHEPHRGNVQLSSKPGATRRFQVWLPLATLEVA